MKSSLIRAVCSRTVLLGCLAASLVGLASDRAVAQGVKGASAPVEAVARRVLAETAALTPPLRRALELASAQDGGTCDDFQQILLAYGEFLELLPLQDLRSVHAQPGAFELEFDFGRRKTRSVELPGGERLVLESAKGRGALGGGKLARTVSEARRLIVHRKVRFDLEAGEIVGIGKGDLEVDAGLFSFDLELRTFTEVGRIARDEKGRIVVARDADGNALTEGQQWMPQRFDRWIEVRAAGRKCEIGVAGRAEVSVGSASVAAVRQDA